MTTSFRGALIIAMVVMCLAPGAKAAGKNELPALGCMLQPRFAYCSKPRLE